MFERAIAFCSDRTARSALVIFTLYGLLVGAPKSIADKLQRALNAAARIVTGTSKYDRGLSYLLHTALHWLHVPQRVQYKL